MCGEIYRTGPLFVVTVSRTVDELRNEIRLAVDRYERQESTAFTKEALAAICNAVDYEIDTNRLPPKSQMRAGILWKIGEIDDDDPDKAGTAFRKDELKSIAASLRNE
ncbi:hypothetical protein SAMN05192552_10488 [Natrinema hispanicum]|uniref:Uncharacterized protein n=1 Tax=Natrinema hispanicum TaxID=392421 RepID=A0A1I0IKY6_9EURY|nr:hypothetical protein SAMN05192552_10488 [Natrinema hispanicum]SET97728.1 hypothetical protein SAMN04488694_12224 [Natrinema hispanicum]